MFYLEIGPWAWVNDPKCGVAVPKILQKKEGFLYLLVDE